MATESFFVAFGGGTGGDNIGLLSTYRASSEGKADILMRSRLVLIGTPQSGQLRRKIGFSRLSGFGLVLPSVGNGLRDAVEDVARRKGMKLKIAAEANSLQIQMGFEGQSDLFTIAAQEAVSTTTALEGLSFSNIGRSAINRTAIMKTTQQRPLSLAGRHTIQAIRMLISK